jgi:serine/threonine-protein kinase
MIRPQDDATTISDRPLPGGALPTRASGVFDRGLDTSAGLDFVRQRLALLGKTVFLLSFSFLVLMVFSVAVMGHTPLGVIVRMPVAIGHFLASSMMGLLWLFAGRRNPSRAYLGALDAFSVILGCSFLAFMSLSSAFKVQEAMAAITVTVMARAILVPSRPLRTLIITAVAFVPTVLMCVVYHHPLDFLPGYSAEYQKLHLIINTTLWSILGIVLATVTSRVIYGLRQQVVEASELGQYILEEKIGSGGMGEVWRARHRLLIRPAAVKLIRRQALSTTSADPELLLRRFEREARATAALKSPHTVELYDFGATDDGTLYYVMELLDGLDLDTLVKRHGPVPAERAVHILRQVCSSLVDAHANGLVHRDIKPANVVVSRAGTTFDFIKVLDFGLVKIDSAQRADEDVKLTTEGTASGTPGFMAPEVVLGAAESDHRVDLYSLGCVAYWLLTGKLVFEGGTAIQIMLHHAHTPAPRPSLRVELPIPTELEDLIMECLEKDPNRRPPSAEVLGARLAAVPLASVWTAERAENWWAAHQPQRADARPVADVLRSHEGRRVRIGQRVRPRG